LFKASLNARKEKATNGLAWDKARSGAKSLSWQIQGGWVKRVDRFDKPA
jgi:hypothetical protein